MQHLEISGVVRLIYRSLGVKQVKGDFPNISLTVLRQRVACRVANVVMELFEIWISG